MKNDTSFIDLTNSWNLNNIIISPVLINYFINVMERMQIYFNKHHFTHNFDYRTFFNETIIEGKVRGKLKILIGDTLNSDIGGQYFEDTRTILINMNDMNQLQIEQALCHEFIHFLAEEVHRRKIYQSRGNYESYKSGFLNEALTEMLALEIYPEFKFNPAYEANVVMMNFVNELCGTINHYQSFLLGKMDVKVISLWKKTREIMMHENNFYEHLNRFHEQNLHTIQDAYKSIDYLEAQRSIICACLEKVKDFNEYIELVKRISNMPIIDFEFTNNILLKKEKELVDKLNISDYSYKTLLLNNLINARKYCISLYRKVVDLPFNNGIIEYYNNTKTYVCTQNPVYSCYVKYQNIDGIYNYDYQINGVYYSKTIDKNEEYFYFKHFEDLLKKQLKYLRKDGSVRYDFYNDNLFENAYYTPGINNNVQKYVHH